nr:hypothetical protein [Tanacetum cinerariifolium]
MESLNPRVVAVVKLPILNPNEFDLWKMIIEKYFLMTYYSLWEVILNEQRLAKKNELKARGTLLMALLDKHLLKFNIHKDAKSLMKAIKKQFGVGGYDWSFQADEDPTNCALMAYISSGSSRSSGSDNELESQVNDKTGLGFDSQVFNSQVSDCKELHSYESDNRVPKNPENDRYKTGEGYHVVPPSYTDDPNASKSVANMFNIESNKNKPSKYMSKTHRPDAPIVKDWISDSKDETEIEFGRFVTAVKLNRGLRDSNYDQLYAYLKQHEAHANKNKMMLDRFTQHTVDPLALMSNVSHQQHYSQLSSTLPSTYVLPHLVDNAHLDSGLSPTDNLIKNLTNMLALLTQSYKTFLPQTNNQLRTSSNTRNQAIVQDGKVLDLSFNVDNVFQADDCDAFDSDVDEASTTQTMFMVNLSTADPVYDEAEPSYDSNILSEVHDHDHYQDVVCENHEEHAMHENVQLNHVVDSHADYTSDSNMILYDQYVKDNTVPSVHSNVSSIPNDAYMMIYNDMYEPHAQYVSKISPNTIVKNLLTAKLATYKEQVKLYERRARFELTKREQKINEQLRIVITNRNFKEETLKRELHSVKLQPASTINHNKLMVEEVTSLKKDFKQKENKYLEDFLDMKSLKEKVEDRLFKQDQSLQTVHMLSRPKPYYNELNEVAIGYKNPLFLTRANQVQPALYNGHEIIKDNHVKIAPHDYSKENFLATFTPQKQLTPEQIFWSQDLIKMKSEALKEQTIASRPIKALTVYPPNTPTMLVPRVLPTKSQVKIHIFTLIQPFSEFDKTCKKRITPTRLTDGERGFEQTKECYLKEVIPFFKTFKEHFEGIQKALTKEIKILKDVFEELEAEVAQNVVDRKHDEIERKNLLIANDNLIAE